ncbi:MAG: hypothetical protein K8H86_03475 [Ignavibacteriaceae bacterium]|nr:hypothetical protein [Ignavibacteriaceae bacterium]
MKKIFAILMFIPLINGCLTFNTLSYKVVLNDENGGTAFVVINDIRSDAEDETEFADDTTKLFNDYFYGDDVIKSLKEEGKEVTSRSLKIDDGHLNAYITFDFGDINSVENLAKDGDFYYLTLPLADSVVSTNGHIILSKDYKRIMWDKNIDTLKFEMFSIAFDDGNYRELAKYYKQK